MKRTGQSLIYIFAIFILSSCILTEESVEVEDIYLSIPGAHVKLLEVTDIDCYEMYWASDGSMIVRLHPDNGMPDLEIPLFKEKEWKDEITSPRMGRVIIDSTITIPDTYPLGTRFFGNITGYFICPVPASPGFTVDSKTIDWLPISVKIVTQDEVTKAYWKTGTPYFVLCCNGIIIIFAVTAIFEIIKSIREKRRK